jgi:hypothetical protein
MKRLSLVVEAVAVALAATVVPSRAQQHRPWVLRDFALEGGHYYVRVPDFVEAPKATFLKDEDRVIGVTGEGVAKAYPAAAVTWHHGVEDQIGKRPIFVTW